MTNAAHNSLLVQLAEQRRTLAVLLRQRANLGSDHAPPGVHHGIEDARAEIDRLKRLLGESAIAVDDHADDSEQLAAQLRAPALAGKASPYLGLLTFQEADANHFFGREALVADLLAQARQAPFLAVLGPSGSGKSSAVRAGLLPALKRGALPGSDAWIYCPPIKPGARPVNSLAAALASLPGAAALGSVFELQERLVAHPDALLVADDTLCAGKAGARLVLLVDQAEELWTLAPADPEAQASFITTQQQPFIGQILSALQAPDRALRMPWLAAGSVSKRQVSHANH